MSRPVISILVAAIVAVSLLTSPANAQIEPAVSITKVVDNPEPNEGDTVTYTVTVTNSSLLPWGVVVVDLLPEGVTHSSHTASAGTYMSDTGMWVFSFGISVGETLEIVATVDAGTNGTTIRNEALFVATLLELDSIRGSAFADITVQRSDLALTKVVDNPSPHEGDTVTYTVTLTNLGPHDATNIGVSDILPAGVTYTGGSADYDQTTNVWSVAELAAGTSTLVMLAATVDPDTDGTIIINTATIAAADQTDPVLENNSDSAQIDVRLMPSQLCFVVYPEHLTLGEDFTVTVMIDPTIPKDPWGTWFCSDCGKAHHFGESSESCEDGFGVRECNPNIAGVVSGQVGLAFSPGTIQFRSARLGGVGESIHVPTGAFEVSSQGDGWARFSFAVPTPPDGWTDPDAMVNGKGAIATFTFRLPESATNFVLGLDPENTSFPISNTDPEDCPSPRPPVGFPEDEWPIRFPDDLFRGSFIGPGPTSISGTVKFWGCKTETNVPFTTLTLNTNPKSHDSEQIENNNDTTGRYNFNVTTFNNYQLSGSRHGKIGDGVFRADEASDFVLQDFGGSTDVRNAITAADVGQIMLHWNDPVGFPLNMCTFDAPDCGGLIYPQRVAADVNAWLQQECPNSEYPVTASTSTINGEDASILQQVIAARILGRKSMPEGYPLFEAKSGYNTNGDSEEGNDCISNWVFFCANKQFGVIPSTGVTYDPVGVLIGDVNGSYKNDGTVPRKPSDASLAIPLVSTQEERVVVPVELRDAESIVGIEAKILFNNEVLRFVGVRAPLGLDTDAPTNHAWGVADDDGTLALVVTGLTEPLSGSSTVAYLEFERVNPSESKATSPILIGHASADDATMKTDNGFFTSSAVSYATWGEVKKLFR